MSRLFRRRLRRALDGIPPPPPDLSALSPDDQILFAVKQVGLKALLHEVATDEHADKPAAGAPLEPERATESSREVVSSTPAETKPASPTKPSRPRHAGEPDPAAIPPQNQYWEEKCRFRFRRLDEPYDDDEPSEEDDLDELLYGSTS